MRAELLIQESLWQRSTHELQLCGHAYCCKALKQAPWWRPRVLRSCDAQRLQHPEQGLRCDDHVRRNGRASGEGCERMPLAFHLGEANIKTVAVMTKTLLARPKIVAPLDPDFSPLGAWEEAVS